MVTSRSGKVSAPKHAILPSLDPNYTILNRSYPLFSRLRKDCSFVETALSGKADLLAMYRCVDQRAMQLTSGTFNTVSDFAILVIPMLSAWNLPLPTKKKLGLIALLGTGLL